MLCTFNYTNLYNTSVLLKCFLNRNSLFIVRVEGARAWPLFNPFKTEFLKTDYVPDSFSDSQPISTFSFYINMLTLHYLFT